MYSSSATEVLQRLASLGVEATVDEDGLLRLRPGSRVPPELVPAIRSHRAALVALLASVAAPEDRTSGLPREDGPEVQAVDGVLRRHPWQPSTAVGKAMVAVIAHQAQCAVCCRRIGGCGLGRALEARWLEEWSMRAQEVVA